MLKLFKSHAPKGRAAKPAAPQPTRKIDEADLARAEADKAAGKTHAVAPADEGKTKELGGPEGPEPTRYGDWERKGICYDF